MFSQGQEKSLHTYTGGESLNYPEMLKIWQPQVQKKVSTIKVSLVLLGIIALHKLTGFHVCPCVSMYFNK